MYGYASRPDLEFLACVINTSKEAGYMDGYKEGVLEGFLTLKNKKARKLRAFLNWCPEEDSNLHSVATART